MDIGENLKNIRELRNYTQEYIAEKLGISQVSYSRIENGLTELSVSRLFLISEILEVDVNTILNFNKEDILGNENPG